MNLKPSITSIIMLVILAMAVSACSTTVFNGTWTDEKYNSGPIKSIMIVGVSQIKSNRNIFESGVSKAFSKQGVQAVTSIQALGDKPLSRENVIEAARAGNLQAVLVTRLVGVEKGQIYTPPTAYAAPYSYYYNWNTYYPHMYDYAGHVTEYTSVHLETNIYDVAGEQLIWTAASETFSPKDLNKTVDELAGKFVKELKRSKLI